MGNDFKFARFVLLPVSEEAKNMISIFQSMHNKTIIRFCFYLGKGYQLQPSASADNPYLGLDYSGFHENLIQ